MNYNSIYTGVEVDEGVTLARAARAQLDLSYSGTWDLTNGVEDGEVIGLALPFTPTHIQLTVECPPGGRALFAVPISGTFSVNGFVFQLSGPTDDVYYRLHYTLKGDGASDSSNI